MQVVKQLINKFELALLPLLKMFDGSDRSSLFGGNGPLKELVRMYKSTQSSSHMTCHVSQPNFETRVHPSKPFTLHQMMSHVNIETEIKYTGMNLKSTPTLPYSTLTRWLSVTTSNFSGTTPLKSTNDFYAQ